MRAGSRVRSCARSGFGCRELGAAASRKRTTEKCSFPSSYSATHSHLVLYARTGFDFSYTRAHTCFDFSSSSSTIGGDSPQRPSFLHRSVPRPCPLRRSRPRLPRPVPSVLPDLTRGPCAPALSVVRIDFPCSVARLTVTSGAEQSSHLASGLRVDCP